MTSLLVTPPADVAAILAGSQTVIAVRGEPCVSSSSCLAAVNWQNVRGGPDPECPCDARQSIYGPPADLVAATEVCTTCGGTGKGDLMWRNLTCRSCLGRGTPPVELVTTCDMCSGRGSHPWPPYEGGGERTPCVYCNEGEIVHGAVGISTLAPIVTDFEWGTMPPAVILAENDTLWLWLRGDNEPIEWADLTDQLRFLPPPTTLTDGGWFIAVLTNPRSESEHPPTEGDT